MLSEPPFEELLLVSLDPSESSEVPVVTLTSSDSPMDRTAASTLGADCYIRKPSNLDEFMAIGETLQGILAKRRRATAT